MSARSSKSSLRWMLICFLLGFLMCLLTSCKTKAVAERVAVDARERGEVAAWSEVAKVDTGMANVVKEAREFKVIKETIIERVYDTDSGVVAKETTTEREIRQDTETGVREEVRRAVTVALVDSVELRGERAEVLDGVVETEETGAGFAAMESLLTWTLIGGVLVVLVWWVKRKFTV